MTQVSETMTQTVQGTHFYIFSILKNSVQITVMTHRTDIKVGIYMATVKGAMSFFS